MDETARLTWDFLLLDSVSRFGARAVRPGPVYNRCMAVGIGRQTERN
jgi:hypothetical protein